nr:fibronectin type III domain-containing protein [Candidatus Levybacteria bacterium]
MKRSFWDKRIPTLLGLLILILGVGTTTFLTNNKTLLRTNAVSSEQPQNVRITNVTDTSFSVSYSTNEKISGSVSYGENNSLGKSAFDERSLGSEKLTHYQVHSITVNNLLPATKYYFAIISGQNTYYNNGKPFEIATGISIPESPTESDTIKGKILLPTGSSPSEAIIYVTSDNSQVLSALTKTDGSYEIPLKITRTGNLSSYYNFNQNSVIKMLAYGDLLTSNITLSKTQINPVPLITLSKDYNFLIKASSIASASADLQDFPSLESTSSATQTKKIQILTPTKNQGLTDTQPLFKGTAKPGENVQIVIHSDQTIQTKVVTDKNGNWSYKPSEPLTPGTHTITITTRDISGILKTITQSFVVYASGTQIQNATGSPTPTPSPKPTATLTPTPTVKATPTPTPTILSSLITTPIPTEALSPTPYATYSGQILPPTGNPSMIILGVVGIILSLMGGLLFLLARRTI